MERPRRETLDYATPGESHGHRDSVLPVVGAYLMGALIGLTALAPICNGMMFHHADLDIWLYSGLGAVLVSVAALVGLVVSYASNRYWDAKPGAAFLAGLLAWAPGPVLMRLLSIG